MELTKTEVDMQSYKAEIRITTETFAITGSDCRIKCSKRQSALNDDRWPSHWIDDTPTEVWEIINSDDVTLASLTYTEPFSCCGSGAVACPWLAADRVLKKCGMSNKQVVSTLLDAIFEWHTVTYLVQVDRAGDTTGRRNDGVWKPWITAWRGSITELSRKHENVQRYHTTVLAGFAFINREVERSYSGSYKRGTLNVRQN